MDTNENKGLGERASPKAILAFFVIIVVVLFGVLYMWGSQLTPKDLSDTNTRTQYTNNEPETVRAKADVQESAVLSSSDEVSTIEADLSSTHIESTDTDLESMNAELTTFESQVE